MEFSDGNKHGVAFAILQQWDFFNYYYLKGQLRHPQIEVFSGKSSFGFWKPDTRIIGISRDHIDEHPWIRVMETLRHEMAHQFVDEVINFAYVKPHGDAFEYACRKLRVPSHASESWHYDKNQKRDSSENPIIQKVAKLLSLAQSPNENEAQLAMKKARELLLKHQLSDDVINAGNSFAHYKTMEIGTAKGRFERWEKKLTHILQDYFFVKIIWDSSWISQKSRMGSIPIAHGRPENLAMADYVYHFFLNLLPNLWEDFKKNQNLNSDRRRREYYYGVLCGFADKLEQQNTHLQQEKALIWTGDKGLDDFYRHLHPRIHSQSSGSATVGEVFMHGKETGQNVVLNKPVSAPSQNSGKLLGN